MLPMASNLDCCATGYRGDNRIYIEQTIGNGHHLARITFHMRTNSVGYYENYNIHDTRGFFGPIQLVQHPISKRRAHVKPVLRHVLICLRR
jgi:hypothetical protein